ncbi:prepilin peptidase [Nocardia inohanensis]|uniref:prepilin peptidase n=1 Tax=Nocardia inohanensis TaxID=209246 RepID=UPI000A06CFFF
MYPPPPGPIPSPGLSSDALPTLTAAAVTPATAALPASALTALLVWCAALSCIDIRYRRLPNNLTLPGAVAVLSFAAGAGRLGIAVAGALLLAGPYLLVHLAEPAALGAGDVKLALGLGAATALGGAQCWVWAALGAPLLSGAGGMVLLFARRVWRSRGPGNTAARGPRRTWDADEDRAGGDALPRRPGDCPGSGPPPAHPRQPRDTVRLGRLRRVISMTSVGRSRGAGANPGGGGSVSIGAETVSEVEAGSRPRDSGAGGGRGGTLAHGPGMCLASLVALVVAG